jgi:hypothetical protein
LQLRNDANATAIDPLRIATTAALGHLQPRKEAATRNPIPLRINWVLTTVFLLAPLPAGAADLKPQAAQGFERYIRVTEQQMKAALEAGDAFLWADRLPEPRRSDVYARLRKGEDIFERLRTAAPSSEISTPGAMIHHWVGTIFIPGVTMQQVLAVVQNYDHHAEYYAPDIARSKTVEHNGSDFKISYRLRKKKILTVILDADFDVHYHVLGPDREYADSFSTRIAQVGNPGEANERELPPGKDGGFLWRLNSYWRYFDTGRGVYMQCEAISLTRDIPAGLGWLIGPMVESLPKESLEFTLQSTRAAVLFEAARATH